MNMLRLFVLVELICFLGGAASPLFAEDIEVVLDVDFEEKADEAVFRLIKDTPPWVTEPSDDARGFILRRYASLTRYNLDDVRAGIVQFLEWVELLPPTSRTAEKSKVFLVTRIVIAVPPVRAILERRKVPIVLLKKCDYHEGKLYSSAPWVMPEPPPADCYYLLAPLALNINGELQLVCDYGVFGANVYYTSEDLLAEFDFFSAEYGPRKECKVAQ